MAIALRAANAVISISNASSTAVTLPAGAAAGDILFICFRIGTSGLTVTQTAGSPTWTIKFQGNNAGTNYTYAFATVVLTPGFTAPTFSWTTSTTWMYAVIALRSTTGALLSVDAWNSAVVNTSATSNTVTPNAVTAATASEASVILTVARASATSSGTDTGTFTPSTNWTTPASGTVFGSSSGANNRFAGVDYQLGVSGTVTPGTESLTDTGSHVYTFVVAHVLVQELAAPAQGVNPPVPRRKLARAFVQFKPVATTNASGVTAPSGTVQPQPTFPVPRRKPARAVWHGLAAPPPGPPPPRQLPVFPRRTPARAVWRGLAAPGPGPLPPRQMPPLPRRRLSRAVVQFTPVVTTNAVVAGVAVAAPVQLPPVPRRKPARAYVQFRAVATVNAAFVPRGQPPTAPDDKPHLKKLLYLVG